MLQKNSDFNNIKINILLYPVSCCFSVIFSPSILIINFYIICHQKDGIITLGTIPPTDKHTYPNIMFTMQLIFLYITISNNKSNKFTRLFILNFLQAIYLILHKIYFLYRCITHKKNTLGWQTGGRLIQVSKQIPKYLK